MVPGRCQHSPLEKEQRELPTADRILLEAQWQIVDRVREVLLELTACSCRRRGAVKRSLEIIIKEILGQ